MLCQTLYYPLSYNVYHLIRDVTSLHYRHLDLCFPHISKFSSTVVTSFSAHNRTKKNRKKVITPDDINSLFSEKKATDDEETEDDEEEEEDNQLAGNYTTSQT